MLEMGIKAKDLEPIIGIKGHVSAVLSGKINNFKNCTKTKKLFQYSC
jgi:HTH-type transcriptional regulator/antitoxin HigA